MTGYRSWYSSIYCSRWFTRLSECVWVCIVGVLGVDIEMGIWLAIGLDIVVDIEEGH